MAEVTVTFNYSVGRQSFSCEAEVDDWDELSDSRKEEILSDAAKDDLEDYIRVDMSSIEVEVDDEEEEDE